MLSSAKILIWLVTVTYIIVYVLRTSHSYSTNIISTRSLEHLNSSNYYAIASSQEGKEWGRLSNLCRRFIIHRFIRILRGISGTNETRMYTVVKIMRTIVFLHFPGHFLTVIHFLNKIMNIRGIFSEMYFGPSFQWTINGFTRHAGLKSTSARMKVLWFCSLHKNSSDLSYCCILQIEFWIFRM